VLGPVLRYADASTATVWVETSAAAQVEVLGQRARTFEVAGHHYGWLVLDGLAPGTSTAYDVRLDGERVWPAADDRRPAPRLRTMSDSDRLDLAFGSCRTGRPEHGPDALHALALACQSGARALPDLLLLLGDQVYADTALPEQVRRRQLARRGSSEPRSALRDFEEYSWLYAESWGEPEVRWLLSTVPTAMIFDDHDVHNGWNISGDWRRRVQALPWWSEHVVGAYTAYWLYQHLGNLPPVEHEADGLLDEVRRHGEQPLRAMARAADRQVHGERPSWWSWVRDIGPARLVVIDTRSGRDLEGGRRSMLTEGEWQQVERSLRGDCEHLLVASSVPLLLEPSLHDIERWNEAVCAGRWGAAAARVGERLRQRIGLDHWAAFSASFDRLLARLIEVADGRRGRAPATVLVLAGDVHHSCVTRLRSPATASPVTEVVSSPLRQVVPGTLRAQLRLASTPPLRLVGRVLARLAGLPRPAARWRRTTPLLFGNGLATLTLEGRSARVRLDRAVAAGAASRLVPVHEERLDAVAAPPPVAAAE
jgi:hypothetical protein